MEIRHESTKCACFQVFSPFSASFYLPYIIMAGNTQRKVINGSQFLRHKTQEKVHIIPFSYNNNTISV